jgi:acetoacetyl-CoA synthetase
MPAPAFYDRLMAAHAQRTAIARVAEAIRSGSEGKFSHLVRLKHGEGRPLFIVHGLFGEVLELKSLADRLATERAVYGIQAQGLDPWLEPHANLAEMAGAYVAAIREAQPSGPYALAGYSFGGIVAYEMARRLRAGGKQVELLALLDTVLWERFLPPADKLAYLFELASLAFRRARVMPTKDVAPYLARKVRQFGHRVLLRLGVRDDFVPIDNLEGPMAERRRRMRRIGADAFRDFRPARYDGRLSLFHIRGPRFDGCDPIPIWRRAVRNIELFPIEGEHGHIMENPHVSTLATQLSRCLAALERGEVESVGRAHGVQLRPQSSSSATGAAGWRSLVRPRPGVTLSGVGRGPA